MNGFLLDSKLVTKGAESLSESRSEIRFQNDH